MKSQNPVTANKELVVVLVCGVYLTVHYARQAYSKRQVRLRQERVDAQLAKVHATLDDIAISLGANRF